MSPTLKNIRYMLRESNAIEDVFDRYALIQAHRAWKYLMQFDVMKPQYIKTAHTILMIGQPIEWKYRGDWRDCPVWIAGEKKSQPKIVIQRQIEEFCFKNGINSDKKDPILLHIEFESIHPFIDGNGRIGRLLLNWQLVKRLHQPLRVFTRDNRREYYRLFPGYKEREFERTLFFIEQLRNIGAGEL